VLDAATFVASAGCLLAVRVPEPRPQAHQHHLRAELLAGARHLAADTVLRRVLLVLVAAWAVTGFSESTVFQVVALGLGRPPAFLGVVSVVQGAGAIVGGLTATGLCRRMGEPALVGLGLAAAALGSLLLAGHGPLVVLPGV